MPKKSKKIMKNKYGQKLKWVTVGRSRNRQKANTIAKSYGKGYKTKVVSQKSGFAVKLLSN